MTAIVIVIAKISLNFTNTKWFQKLRISNKVKIFLYKPNSEDIISYLVRPPS